MLMQIFASFAVLLITSLSSTRAEQTKASLELFVADAESQAIKYYDAKTGKYIRDFSVGNGLGHPGSMVFGADGNLYVSTDMPSVVQLFDGKTGQFLKTFASGHNLNNCTSCAFGSDGKLYVVSAWENQIKRFDATTGVYVDEFLTKNTGGLDVIPNMTFGLDGHVYLISANNVRGKGPNLIKRYNGKSGEFMGDFAGGNGVDNPRILQFGPDGNLYVLNMPFYSESVEVKRFDGKTGAFIDTFIARNAAEMKQPATMTFGPDGNLYIGSGSPASVKCFDGRTGKYLREVVAAGAGNLRYANAMTFRPVSSKRKK
jgi:outer membrane protein assembly factor BamB